MSAPDDVTTDLERGRTRSRLRFAALLACFGLLAACTAQFGAGITDLPAQHGWQPLPIGAWVVNDGLEPRTIVYCPRETCVHQGVAALISVSGPRADELERTLRADPARLARDFAKPSEQPKRDQTKAKPKATAPKSTTSVSRYDEGGTPGLLVEIRARDGSAKQAATAILYGREAGKLTIAIAVSDDAEKARNYARSAWSSR